MPELLNKIALVTGASKGIGRAISLALAAQGARVVLASRDEAGLAQTADLISEISIAPTPLVVTIDQTDPVSINSGVAKVLGSCGQIDVLVNNSGIAGANAPLWELSEAEWDLAMDTNLKGPYLVSKAIIPSMISQGSGSIIFIGSITGKRPLAHRSVYAASKLGMVGLMRTLALELGEYGIRVNLISPGYVDGPRLDSVIEKVAQRDGVAFEDKRAEWLEMVPMGSFISAENIAQGVLFFASNRSAGITGDDLNISGGLVMY